MAEQEKVTGKQVSVKDEPAKRSAPVIPLPTGKVAEVVSHSASTKLSSLKKNAIAISFIVCVLLPGLIGIAYFMVIAADRYAAGAGFSVRSMDATATGGDFLGALSGLTSIGSTTSDSYIIIEFLKSRELVEFLKEEADFLDAYSTEKADFFYRLNPEDPIEDILEYWEWMIGVTYDNASELIKFEVQAFTPEDAEKIANLITKKAQDLVNRLSAEARRDAVSFAKREVSSAELRLKLVREELRRFRADTNAVDPSASAAALLQLTTTIEGQIIEQRARLTNLRQSLAENAPPIEDAKRQIEALQNELAAKQAEISTNVQEQNLAGILADYERLQVEQEFAQQAYTVALSSLERARAEADRQQRFLAVFNQPARPVSAIYPSRELNSFLVFLVAFLAWGIGLFLFFSVRDHLR